MLPHRLPSPSARTASSEPSSFPGGEAAVWGSGLGASQTDLHPSPGFWPVQTREGSPRRQSRHRQRASRLTARGHGGGLGYLGLSAGPTRHSGHSLREMPDAPAAPWGGSGARPTSSGACAERVREATAAPGPPSQGVAPEHAPCCLGTSWPPPLPLPQPRGLTVLCSPSVSP